MNILFTEPVSPRYIHVNPETNRVHLMVPVVGGQEISTDNTCKATEALREFFEGGALRELTAYKNALAFDIALLEAGHPQRVGKEARLAQVEAYIEAVSAMRHSYGAPMTAFLARPSNLYSIQLRPREPGPGSQVVNPVFNIERGNNAGGTSLSPLYNAMHSTFPSVVIPVHDPRTRLTKAVLDTIPESPSFEIIKAMLREQCLTLFGLTIDFTRCKDGTPADKAVIDGLMGFGDDATPQNYIDALLGACAPDMWATIPAPASPFYSIPATPVDNRTERLSILTQFFLANLNIYCKSKGISTKNFGAILDASNVLSNDLVSMVSEVLSSGDDVERALCVFCNIYAVEFGLSRSLNAEDVAAVKQTFERTYRTVTATEENPHMDDFMILDKEATGETAKFVTHQGAICVDFAEIVDVVAASANPGYFASIRIDFAAHSSEIPHRNESVVGVVGGVDMEPETLLTRLNDEQIERLPQAAKDACRAHPNFQLRHFWDDVAKGRQDEAEALLTTTPANTQTLLRTPGVFTDYSGRTVNCTAYEYAYWAKDTHMCRMLERHMDEETKAQMLERIDAIEATGLSYQKDGAEHRSAHFDLTELKTALQEYVNGGDAWYAASNWAAMQAAWMVVGKAQRDVPAHIAQEYCRPGQSFYPTPQFNEPTLPRALTFYNFNTGASDSWFPLSSSNAGLGFDFALIWPSTDFPVAGAWRAWGSAFVDLAEITRLDEVRIVDLTLSRDHLNPRALAHGMSM